MCMLVEQSIRDHHRRMHFVQYCLLHLCALVIVLIMYIANRITKPITRIGKNIDQMVANIGEDDPMRGVERVDTVDAYGDEVTAFGRNFNAMTGAIQQWRTDAADNTEQNAFYGGGHEWIAPPAYTYDAPPAYTAYGINSSAASASAPTMFPTGAPPPYDQVLAEKQAAGESIPYNITSSDDDSDSTTSTSSSDSTTSTSTISDSDSE